MARSARAVALSPAFRNQNSTRFICSTKHLAKPNLPVEIPPPEYLTQASNRDVTWSPSQNPRPEAMSGPRFEQIDFSLQPQSMAAITLIEKEPLRLVNGRKAYCDGGLGDMGHPRVYLNLDKPDTPVACGYCGLRFMRDPESHHKH
ncbi:hypothetical protein BB560_003579 [Smittium megazygosporum]|uniref:Zinc finger CHCC-type domain-containing protein n=1 Tax=Smittium megazygosporum TaxID=133381 RepID=A0A2T9ZBM3_9FUNG|nr:hypothetical protein BB560_003579 [Smittium megazygosporum]